MKRAFKTLLVVASVAAAFISCSKELSAPNTIGQDEIQVTIQAGAPVTKTMISGTTPYWCDGDAIGVSNQTKDNNKQFTENSIGTGLTAETATFSGSVAATGTYYAYYPYTSNGVSTSGAKVDIPLTQHPTATSFDGSADVLVSKSFVISSTESTTIENLEFARLGAIIKVVLIDDASSYTLSTEKPTSVSITAPTNLVGRVYVDMANQSLGELYYNQSTTATAEYSTTTQFAINGTNGAYLVVYPQTLAAGEDLTVSVVTSNFEITKTIKIPVGGIVLKGGSVTVLKIKIADANIAAVSAGAALPFNDNMAWANNGSSDDNTDISSSIASSTNSNGLYVSGSKAYKGKGGLKLGSSSAPGYVVTKELDLSGAFYIAIEAGKYGSDTGSIQVSIDGDSPVINVNDFSDVLYANIAAGTYTNKSQIKIATSSKRAYLYSVEIATGVYTPSVPASSITVMTADATNTSSTDGETATLNGSITLNNGAVIADVTEAGFYYKAGSGTYTKVQVASPSTTLTYNLTGLTPSTVTYTYYAYAIYGSNEVTGSEVTFNTTATGGNPSTPTDYTNVYTSNVTLSTGTSAQEYTLTIGGSEYSGVKAGASKAGGSMTFVIPIGTTRITLHAQGWGSDTPTVSIGGATVSPSSFSPAANSEYSGNGTSFTITTSASDDYVFSVSNVTSPTTITLSTSEGKKRFVVWGVNVD